jgi:predicted NAD/FAD-dependent oxidoreductase
VGDVLVVGAGMAGQVCVHDLAGSGVECTVVEAGWFDASTADWEHLRTDVVRHGQPRQDPPFDPRRRVALGGGRFVCGDHRDTASLQGAMFSGERTAVAVLHHLAG